MFFWSECKCQHNVIIGNGVKVQNNVSIYEGVELEDDVFVDLLWYLLMI